MSEAGSQSLHLLDDSSKQGPRGRRPPDGEAEGNMGCRPRRTPWCRAGCSHGRATSCGSHRQVAAPVGLVAAGPAEPVGRVRYLVTGGDMPFGWFRLDDLEVMRPVNGELNPPMASAGTTPVSVRNVPSGSPRMPPATGASWSQVEITDEAVAVGPPIGLGDGFPKPPAGASPPTLRLMVDAVTVVLDIENLRVTRLPSGTKRTVFSTISP